MSLSTSQLSLSATLRLNQLENMLSENEDSKTTYTPILKNISSNEENSLTKLNDYTDIQNMVITQKEDGSLMDLFKKAISTYHLASKEEKLEVKKMLNSEIFTECRCIIPSFQKTSTLQVQPQIKELDFITRYAEIDTLLDNSKQLREKASVRINLIAGATPTLNPKDPDYNKKKEAASNYFKSYESLFNKAVDMLNEMNTQETEIINLKKLSNETTTNFINENCKRYEYFKSQFDILASEHGFVHERVEKGYETAASHWFGVSSSVVLPKAVVVEELSQSKLDLSNNFTSFFQKINQYYDELKDYSALVQSHLNKVAGTRKAWNEKNPYFLEFKDEARLLPKNYEPLAKECSKIYKILTDFNENLTNLSAVLEQKLSDKAKAIGESRQLLIETFNTYAMESQKLDKAMNNHALVICKDMRFLTAETKEKYPISKENEKKKEVIAKEEL